VCARAQADDEARAAVASERSRKASMAPPVNAPVARKLTPGKTPADDADTAGACVLLCALLIAAFGSSEFSGYDAK
jgi:hypothetical protein